jgi:hypothetical protein
MNTDNAEAHAGVVQRREQYRRTIEVMARRGAVSGRPGPWLDIARRAAGAYERADNGAGCDVALHANYLELTLWGQILEELVRPEWQGELEAAIVRVAGEETSNLDERNELSLGLVRPGLDPSIPAPEATNVSFEELILIRQLREATRRGTANALREALESWLALSRVPAGSSGHSTCGAWDLLTVRVVVIRALVETMPLVYRRVLAAFAQRAFYGLYVPDEPVPEFLDQVPSHMKQGEDIWTFTPTWSGVAFGYGKGPDRDPSAHPWLVEDLAIIAHRWESEEAERKHRVIEELERRIRAG